MQERLGFSVSVCLLHFSLSNEEVLMQVATRYPGCLGATTNVPMYLPGTHACMYEILSSVFSTLRVGKSGRRVLHSQCGKRDKLVNPSWGRQLRDH